MMRAEPIRADSRLVSAPPSTPPTLASANVRPTSPAGTCRNPDEKDHLHRGDHAAEQVRHAGTGDDMAQDEVPDDERQTLGDLGTQPAAPGRGDVATAAAA